MIQYLGFVAAFLTTFAFAPQAFKTIRTKNTESISLPMYLILTVGIACWFIYGIYKNDAPIILANAVTLFLSSIILILKIKHG